MLIHRNGRWQKVDINEKVTIKELSRWVDSYDILKHYLREYAKDIIIRDNAKIFIPKLGGVKIVKVRNKGNIYRAIILDTGETLNVIHLLQRMFDLDKQSVVNKIAEEITCIYDERKGLVFRWVQDKPETAKFSFFNKPITNTIPSKDITLEELAKSIKSYKYKEIINQIRNAPDKTSRSELKRDNLDFVTISGQFTKRNANNLMNHSGLLCLDFDDVENPNELKAMLVRDTKLNPKLIFISPSGCGLKCVVEVDVRKYSHESYFRALERYFSNEYEISIDSSGKDVCRACFVSFDPELYFREN